MQRLLLLLAVAVTIAYGLNPNANTNSVGDDNPSNVDDQITELPGLLFSPNFTHYSGFLQVSPTHFLHYWLVESQGNPATDPLVFWFNGGPGCSSLEGLLNELGPYVIEDDGKSLRANPNSWGKYASIVFIEAPAGVGFSYSSNGNISTNDDLTSQENYEGIKVFFDRHPSFRNHSVYITGESYGGIYIPTLTARVIDGQSEFTINLKGIAIGNGMVNDKLNIDTSVRFAYAHGIIDEKVWNTLELECCRGCIDGCDLTQVTGYCAQMVEDIFEFLWHGGLNPYDLYRDCDPSPTITRSKVLQAGLMPPFMKARLLARGNSTQSQGSDGSLKADAPCLNDTSISQYMNSQAVRDALHIPSNLGKWEICSDEVGAKYGRLYQDMSPFIKKILAAHVRVLLYYGDTDIACNFLMGQKFSAGLNLKRVINKQIWKAVGSTQIAGFKTVYGGGLTFITVKGAGHMAPQWRAPQMDYVISQFLSNHPI